MCSKTGGKGGGGIGFNEERENEEEVCHVSFLIPF